jgi:hypothetical protein
MLPKKHTIRALRLARSYGELRVGVLNHDAARSIGPGAASPLTPPKPRQKQRRRFTVELDPIRKL